MQKNGDGIITRLEEGMFDISVEDFQLLPFVSGEQKPIAMRLKCALIKEIGISLEWGF
jgi:hypothetical protein